MQASERRRQRSCLVVVEISFARMLARRTKNPRASLSLFPIEATQLARRIRIALRPSSPRQRHWHRLGIARAIVLVSVRMKSPREDADNARPPARPPARARARARR